MVKWLAIMLRMILPALDEMARAHVGAACVYLGVIRCVYSWRRMECFLATLRDSGAPYTDTEETMKPYMRRALNLAEWYLRR